MTMNRILVRQLIGAATVSVVSSCGQSFAEAEQPSEPADLSSMRESSADLTNEFGDDNDKGEPDLPFTNGKRSVAYDWITTYLNVTATEVTRNGARPTIISRASYILTTSMYQAWAAYDNKAVGTEFGRRFRRPPNERNMRNREIAVSYAAYRAIAHLYPNELPELRAAMIKQGLNPDDASTRLSTPQGVGNVSAAAVIESRRNDGSNAFGQDPRSDGTPFSDTTGYVPVNTVDRVVDADKWQPITFTRADGTKFTPPYLTPHWGFVKPFGLLNGAQFRPPPPPLLGSAQLTREIQEVIDENANLTLAEKAIVEYMRDGPFSVSQSGQWLGFAQVVSRRDNHNLEKDIKMFFALGGVHLDTFIASWEAKLFYNSSRPWTLVRTQFAGRPIKGWGGPGKGTVSLTGDKWFPYAPSDFITPPFPGYVSGHSTVSAGSARVLELFTGSDAFGVSDPWTIGSLTEPNIPCNLIQQVEGMPLPPANLSCQTQVLLPTFTATAELAGISRIYGGFHIQADNIAGLVLGRQVAQLDWDVAQSYFNGRPRRNQR